MTERTNIDEKNVARAVEMMASSMKKIEKETGILLLGHRPSRTSFRGPAQEIVYINTRMSTIGAVYHSIPEEAIPQPESWEALEKVFDHLDEHRSSGVEAKS